MSQKKNSKISLTTSVKTKKESTKKTLLTKFKDSLELPLLLRRHY